MPYEPDATPQRRPAGSADPLPAWPAPYPPAWPEGAPVPTGDQELASLLQFFYQCPVGLFEVDDAGRVNMVNPAAVALLAPVIADGDLSTLFPLLARLAPQLFAVITTDRGRMGPLTAGQRMVVPVGGSQAACVEMQAVRVAPNRVMIVVQDVPAGQQLALRERDIAAELRLAMLGRADEVPGLAVGVTYRAADADLRVGGDWYDVIALPGNRAGLMVGGTVGHNLAATSAMGQLRSALRATARYRPEPAELLGLADTIALGIDGAPSATLAYGLLDLASGQLSYASAGHPPILVIRSDGSAQYLTGGRGLPLGIVAAGPPRTAGRCTLAAGDIAVMFTDGLYQQRDEPHDDLLAALQRQAVRFRHLPPAEMSRELTEAMLASRAASGDTCVLVTAR